MAHAALLQRLRALLGQHGLLTEPSDVAPHCVDWRGLYRGATPAVARPSSTAELAAVVQICAELDVPMVPQGGNTSMVGGAVPSEAGTQLVVSLSRMSRVRDIDPLDMTMTVDAGVTLKAAQEAAAAVGCLLPLSISAEGTAQIGGVLGANAGGNNTLRHGNARDLVLGLEAVFADGAVWNGLRRLRKDNTGYALRHLLIGSEGTLGFITAAVLRLVPAPAEREVALCAVASPAAALELFARFRRHDAGALLAFEYMSGAGVDLVVRHIPGVTLPLSDRAPAYALVELAGSALRAGFERVLEAALDEAVVTDAVLAASEAQRAAIWRLREEQSEAQRLEGASVKNDVSVTVSRVPELIARASTDVVALVPGARPMPFGHVGDGNIHMNFVQPVGADGAAFLAQSERIVGATNAVISALDGSFSAEHGVGRLKVGLMARWRGGAELDAMHRIKQALDPRGLMNPGKLLP